MSEKEEVVIDNIQFTLSEASELTTYLASLNCRSEPITNDGYEPDWEHFDVDVRKVDDALKLVNDDWQIFRENYAVLKEKYNDDD